MCTHTSTLMLAAEEVASAVARHAEHRGHYTCRTCCHRCTLHVTFPDEYPQIEVNALTLRELPVVYNVGADQVIRRGSAVR